MPVLPRWYIVANRIIDAALIAVGIAALATVPFVIRQIVP